MTTTTHATVRTQTGFGHTQCPYCGASLANGTHVCPKKPADADVSDVETGFWSDLEGYDPSTAPEPEPLPPTRHASERPETLSQAHHRVADAMASTAKLAPSQVIDAVGGKRCANPPEWTRNVSRLTSLFGMEPGTKWVPLEGDEPGDVRLVAYKGWFANRDKVKVEGHRAQAENLSDILLKRDFLSDHPEYDEEEESLAQDMFDRFDDPRYAGGKNAAWWDDAPVDPTLVRAAMYGHGEVGPTGEEPSSRNRGWRGVGESPEGIEWLRDGLVALPFRTVDREVVDADGRFRTVQERRSVAVIDGKEVLIDPVEAVDELAGRTRRAKKARVLRDYRAYLTDHEESSAQS